MSAARRAGRQSDASDSSGDAERHQYSRHRGQGEREGAVEDGVTVRQERRRETRPGVGFGEYGEGYVRLGLVENEHRIRQAARGVRRVMQNAEALLARYREEEAAG